METVCGINLKNFAKAPTPEELGTIVAHWDSDNQAMFFVALGEELRNCCGGSYANAMQWQYIADSISELEEKLCDGSGSQLIDEIAQRLKIPAA